jgi:hypothetical protein
MQDISLEKRRAHYANIRRRVNSPI